ncbi:sensor histidine kinase [Aurantiacibacter luteus]|uniref:sensor histidine kinase n=1 Tax=Aurantiacibacter luteus TaxID=1581420 RepID=UPI0024094A8A|nr:ATP-binding protein [Aurantiacibacter luteus]
MLENEPNLVFVKNELGEIVWANQAFKAIYAPDERDNMIGSTTVESFSEEEADLFLSEDRRAMREGRTEIVEEVVDWTGRKITLLTRKLAIELANGQKRLIGISTDITDLAARERRLVQLNAQLKVYSHSVAHDLKNPIASIISAVNIIKRDQSTTLGERGKMVLEALRESATGLSNSITAMLKAAANEAENLSFTSYDLNILLEEVRFNLSAAIETAEMDLHVARLPTATVEPNLLRQLFQNLIENSIKHAAAARLVVTIHYSLIDDEHVFYVGDNGTGIPENKREQVFRQFFKGGGSDDGLGLGLTICQRIAHLHDGVIEIHDKVERGCCMVLRIPAR